MLGIYKYTKQENEALTKAHKLGLITEDEWEEYVLSAAIYMVANNLRKLT